MAGHESQPAFHLSSRLSPSAMRGFPYSISHRTRTQPATHSSMACVFAYAIYSGMPSRLGLSRHVTAYGTPGISFSDPPDRHLVAPGAHSVPFNASRLSMMALHQLALRHSPAALISSPRPGRGFHTRTFILGLVTCVCLAVTEAPAQDTAPASDPVLAFL